MKCDNCPLNNYANQCPGENAHLICSQIRKSEGVYYELIKEIINNKNQNVQPPNIFKKAINYGISYVHHLLLGKPTVIESVHKARLAICADCDLCDKDNNGVWTCLSCGCPVKEKTLWADQQCPLEPPKWTIITDPSQILQNSKNMGCSSCGDK